MANCLFCILPLLLTCDYIDDTSSAKILALFPIPSASHQTVFEALTTQLAARGHELTVVTSHPQKTPIPNYKDISIEIAFEQSLFENLRSLSFLHIPYVMCEMGNHFCELELSSPQVQELIHSDEKFDLIIIEVFFNECFLGFVHKFPAPVIAISSLQTPYWGNSLVANPDMFSSSPHFQMPVPDRMSFWERLANAAYTLEMNLIRHLYLMTEQNRIAQRYFGNSTPPLEDIEKNTDFVIVNSHFVPNYPRPNVPNMIEAGGMHVKPSGKLPQDLQKFLDEAKDGVVYFSLGSNLRSDKLPEDKRRAFLEAFGEIPHKILWKFESEHLPDQPKNVKISKWLPQKDILGHPNVKAFISHCGLLSVQEAFYNGVPLVGIPHFGDQPLNMRRVEMAGTGIALQYDNITKYNLLDAVRRVINDHRYRENARKMSVLMKDQPETPLQRAVFWTEYVLRHKGAPPHMRSAAIDLTWYQYFMLDAILFVLCMLAFLLGTLHAVLKYLYKFLVSLRKPKKY